MDEHGNVVERGEAEPFPESAELWSYVAEVPLPSGTFVIVQAAAIDCLGGVGVLRTAGTI